MKWLRETHGVQFELVRHFLRRMFDGEWSRAGTVENGGDGGDLAAAAGGHFCWSAKGRWIRGTPPSIALLAGQAERRRCARRRRSPTSSRW